MQEREPGCEYMVLEDTDGVVLRNRRDGDRIHPIGASGGKSLKKYLIDKKIPLHERDELVLVARGEQVLAVVGITVADMVAVGKNEGKIYKISVR
jgi:tRNA(Ile)-lysidine synthase